MKGLLLIAASWVTSGLALGSPLDSSLGSPVATPLASGSATTLSTDLSRADGRDAAPATGTTQAGKGSASLRAQTDRRAEFIPFPSEGDGPRQRSIKRGLDWLAGRQDDTNGALRVDDAEAGQRAPLAVTAFAALAWMSGGSTPTRGRHQQNVRRAIDYLLANTHGEADTHPGYIANREDKISRTHGHGMATLALAQAYTVSPQSPLGKRIGRTLVAAVRRIELSQGAEGGWEYEPFRTLQHEGSVTVCLVQALRAAKNAGIDVDASVIAKAVDYVERLQVTEAGGTGKLGGFKYGLHDPTVSVALTAAALSTMQAAGVYEGPRIDEGYDYVWRTLRLREVEPDKHSASFPYYERFYLSQALWQHRETKHYRAWAEPIMNEVVAAQDASGRWRDERSVDGHLIVNRYGAAYATACNILFLALPDDSLPIFHR